jgi:hypothetical protein
METLDRLLDSIKSQVESPEEYSGKLAQQIQECGKVTTDAKDILLQVTSDIINSGPLAVQIGSLLQLVYRDAYLAKIPYRVPVTIKDMQSQAPLGPNPFLRGRCDDGHRSQSDC